MKKYKRIWSIAILLLVTLSCENETKDPSDNDYAGYGLSAPQQITAQTVSSTSIRISWTTVSGAYQYLVYRSATNNGIPAPIDYTFNNYFIDHELIPGEIYFYRVAAIDSDFNAGPTSKYAQATTDMPQAPSKPTAEGVSSTQIRVSWTTVPGAIQYQIFRSVTAEGDFGTIPLAETEENAYVDSGLQPNSTYYYKIVALTKNGTKSPMSNYAAGTTMEADPSVPLPTAPLNVTATAQSSNSILISWNPVVDTIHYIVYRGTSARGSPTGTTYSDTGLSAGTTYTYSVSAVNSAGEGPKSASRSATTNVATLVVTFDSAGGTSVPSQNVTSGGRVTRPTNPTRAGFDFVDWQRNGTTYNFNNTVTASFTLTARWTPKTIAAPAISSITMTSDDNGYRVQWGAVSGAESYRIYKSNSKNGIFNYLGSVTGTVFEDRDPSLLQVGATVFYQITALRKEQGTVDIESAKSTARGVTASKPRIRQDFAGLASIGNYQVSHSDYVEISPGTYSFVGYGIIRNPNGTTTVTVGAIFFPSQTYNINTTYTLSIKSGQTGQISSISSHLQMQ